MKTMIMRRFAWNVGPSRRRLRRLLRIGDGAGYSNKLSISWIWEPRDTWIGAYWKRVADLGVSEWSVYLCLLPCLPIRFHYRRSYGGIFPAPQR